MLREEASFRILSVDKGYINGVRHKYRGDAGYDMVLKSDAEIPPGDFAVLATRTYVKNVDAMVMARTSSLSSYGLIIVPTLVDKNYEGYLHIHLFNPSHRTVKITTKDYIAQIVPFERARPDIFPVNAEVKTRS